MYAKISIELLVHFKGLHQLKYVLYFLNQALHNLVPLDPLYFIKVVLPKLIPLTLSDKVSLAVAPSELI